MARPWAALGKTGGRCQGAVVAARLRAGADVNQGPGAYIRWLSMQTFSCSDMPGWRLNVTRVVHGAV